MLGSYVDLYHKSFGSQLLYEGIDADCQTFKRNVISINIRNMQSLILWEKAHFFEFAIISFFIRYCQYECKCTIQSDNININIKRKWSMKS